MRHTIGEWPNNRPKEASIYTFGGVGRVRRSGRSGPVLAVAEQNCRTVEDALGNSRFEIPEKRKIDPLMNSRNGSRSTRTLGILGLVNSRTEAGPRERKIVNRLRNERQRRTRTLRSVGSRVCEQAYGGEWVMGGEVDRSAICDVASHLPARYATAYPRYM